MTVQELIKILNEVEDKSQKVIVGITGKYSVTVTAEAKQTVEDKIGFIIAS